MWLSESVEFHDVVRSREDASVNFLWRGSGEETAEARYVRRRDDTVIIYLSSQTGCAQACRMCHLTATRQNRASDLPPNQIIEQASSVLGWYRENARPARIAHFNFMARGEPLANTRLVNAFKSVIDELCALAVRINLVPRIKVSTIMPRQVEDRELARLFQGAQPDLYYSIYSVDDRFRKRWLPLAIPAQTALRQLKSYQDQTRKIPVLHWALIRGENDAAPDVSAVCRAVNEVGLRADVNIVRYNPYSTEYGEEASEQVIEERARQIGEELPGCRVKIVSRVGFDVQASCGMFVESLQREPIPTPVESLQAVAAGR